MEKCKNKYSEQNLLLLIIIPHNCTHDYNDYNATHQNTHITGSFRENCIFCHNTT